MTEFNSQAYLKTAQLTESIKMQTSMREGMNLQREGINQMRAASRQDKERITDLEERIAEAEAALAKANALVDDWSAAMEAWKDLAVTLREEIKACPNQEAHKFGKDFDARNKRLTEKEDAGRKKRGLKPKYSESK